MRRDKRKGHFSHGESGLSSCPACSVWSSILGGVRVGKQPGRVRGERGERRGTPQLFRVCPASAATAMLPNKKTNAIKALAPDTLLSPPSTLFLTRRSFVSLFVLSLRTLMHLRIRSAHSYGQGLWLNRSPRKSRQAIRHRSKWILGRDNVLCKTAQHTNPDD